MNRAEGLQLADGVTPVCGWTGANGEYVGLLEEVVGRHGPWRGKVKILGCLKPASFDYIKRQKGHEQRKGFRIGEIREFDGINITVATKERKKIARPYKKALERDIEQVKEMRKRSTPEQKKLCDDILKWRRSQLKKIKLPTKKKLAEAREAMRLTVKRKPKGRLVNVTINGEKKQVRRRARRRGE